MWIADCGLRIADWGRVGGIRNPKSEIRNPKRCGYVVGTAVLIGVFLALLSVLCSELLALEVRTPEGGAAAMFEYKVFEDWEESDSIWGDLWVAHDGKVYIGVSNHLAVGGNTVLYCYTPEADELKVVADIGEVIGQDPGAQAVGQGKIHTRVMEGKDGWIYA